MGCFFDCPPYEWQVGTSDGLLLPIFPPRGMRSSTLLRGLIKFCNYDFVLRRQSMTRLYDFVGIIFFSVDILKDMIVCWDA